MTLAVSACEGNGSYTMERSGRSLMLLGKIQVKFFQNMRKNIVNRQGDSCFACTFQLLLTSRYVC